MTDKSAFSEDEWHALAEAPLHITLAMVAVGQHGPISMVKEMAASAREMAKPGDRGAATAVDRGDRERREQRARPATI